MMNIAHHDGGRRLLLASALAVALVLLLTPGAARADYGLSHFSATFQDASGAPVTQAGAHADLVTDMVFNTAPDPVSSPRMSPDEQVKDVRVDLPTGFYGNPKAIATCTPAQLVATQAYCAPDAQVGLLRLQLQPDSSDPSSFFTVPVYNMVAADGEPAALAAFVIGPLVKISIAVRSDSDYGLQATLSNLNQGLPVYATRLTLWGTPSDPAHDPDRMSTAGAPNTPSGGEQRPFLTMPARCEPVTTTVTTRSWQNRDRWVTARSTSPTLTGCDRLRFQPEITMRPVVTQADKPSGYDVDVAVPQPESIASLGTPQLRRAVMTLPEGVAISPASAAGLEACSDAQLALGTRNEPTCPDASKVGTVSITTPLLAEPLQGDIVVGSPTPEHLFRIFIVARGSGIVVKLPGIVEPDERTGQLTTVFDDAPQLPFSRLHLHFKGGDRAPLANPQSCGTKSTATQLTAWDGSTATPGDAFAISGCTGGFAPAFEAGTLSAGPGQFTPFAMTLRRDDGDQDLSAIDMALPSGLLGFLAGVPRCDELPASAGFCDPATQIGTTTVESGSGGQPLALAGKVFLAGPYKSAPYSLSIVVRAVAGPYDLGTVVVRVALRIDPVDAHVTAVSDPLPTIVKGVPLRLRTVNVTLDRDRFMRTPTNCTPSTITANLHSVSGALVSPASTFQVANCAALSFAPKLSLALGGRGQTTDGKHPALSASVTQGAGQANLQKMTAELPLALALDPDNAQSDRLCTFEAGAKTIPDCPARSIVGTATAVTPVLDQPLSGPVYFIKNIRVDPKTGRPIRTLPTLAIVLQGGGVQLVLRATTAVVDGKLVTTFGKIPDTPVRSFTLNLNGGKEGILVITGAGVCNATQLADLTMDAQNGRVVADDVTIATSACPLKVISKTVGAKSVTVKIGGLGAGKVTVSGKGIKTTTRTLTSSTVATVVAKRTGRARPTSVRASFIPKGAKRAKAVTASLLSGSGSR